MNHKITDYLNNHPGTLFVLMPNGDGTWLAGIEEEDGDVHYICETAGSPEAAIDALASELA